MSKLLLPLALVFIMFILWISGIAVFNPDALIPKDNGQQDSGYFIFIPGEQGSTIPIYIP